MLKSHSRRNLSGRRQNCETNTSTNSFNWVAYQRWATVKLFSPSPILIQKIIQSCLIRKLFLNHQSDLVPIRPSKTVYFYFVSWNKNTAGVILPLAKHDWLKAKSFQQCFCLMSQNRHSFLAFPKFNKVVSILPHEAKALLELYCH